MSSCQKFHWMRRIVWATVAWLAVTVLFGPFGSISICEHCGRARRSTEFQIPLIDVPYFWLQRINDTEFSSRLSSIVPAHECRWLFGHGGGTGFNASCALGNGSSLLNIVNRPMIASFILNVDRFEGRAAAQAWIAKTLDHNHSESVRHWLVCMSFPDTGFDTEAEYSKWKTRADTEEADLLTPNQ